MFIRSKLLIALALTLAAATTASAHDKVLPDSGGSQEIVIADGREILAERNGLSVYTFDPDNDGPSVCYDKCAAAWPPVVVDATEVVKAPFGTSARKDGALQLTYENKPLYTFVGDANPGDITGDGLNEVWHLIVLEEAEAK